MKQKFSVSNLLIYGHNSEPIIRSLIQANGERGDFHFLFPFRPALASSRLNPSRINMLCTLFIQISMLIPNLKSSIHWSNVEPQRE
jgi:hypothetical protein